MPKRKTDKEFKKEVYDLVNNEYVFLEPYVNSKTKLRVKHNKCGDIYKVRPSDFLNNGSRCPYCSNRARGKARMKTDTQFQQEVYDLVGNEYVFLGTYINTMTKIKVKHNKCGKVYKVKPNDFLQGHRCPYCSDNFHPKKTDAQFKQEVYDLVGNEYTFLDPYVDSRTKIKVKHNKCGKVYKVTPSSFLNNGSRCPYCAGLAKKTDSQFKQEVRNLVGNEYVFLDSYVNTMTKIKVKHNKCGNIYEVAPNNFLGGHRCPYCYDVRKTNTQFQQEVYNLVGNEYVFLNSYVNNRTKLRVKHNKCGNIYEIQPNNFLNGSRCPYCNSRPKGEVFINKILKSLGIKYEYQKTFDDLKDTSLLSYDFFIPDQNILIEYQGKQHYQPIDYFGGDDKFKIQQKHDKMKSDYAKGNGYNLIAVPYTEDTFSKIKKYLVKHGLEQRLKSAPKKDDAFYFNFA